MDRFLVPGRHIPIHCGQKNESIRQFFSNRKEKKIENKKEANTLVGKQWVINKRESVVDFVDISMFIHIIF